MNNGKATQSTDLELQVCNVQEQVLKLLDEEENLRHLKRETAKDFRIKIDEIKARRLKAMQQLTDLQQKTVEDQGTLIIKDGKPQVMPNTVARV